MCFQSVAELEQKWQNEVEESQQGKLEDNTPFFHDYHFFEVHFAKHTVYIMITLAFWFDIYNSLVFCCCFFGGGGLEQNKGAGTALLPEGSPIWF